MIAMRLGVAALVVAALGMAAVMSNYSTYEPAFFLGLTMLAVASVLGVGAAVASRSVALDDAFQSGVRVGYRRGRRCSKLSIVRHDESA